MTGAAAIAFYKGKGDWRDRVVRSATRSMYSHCELIAEPASAPLQPSRIISASARDGGVRMKSVHLDDDRWDILRVEWCTTVEAVEWMRSMLGQQYDFRGIVLSQAIGLNRHRQDAWFCSEICAAAINMSMGNRLSPGELFARIFDQNAAYRKGFSTGLEEGRVRGARMT